MGIAPTLANFFLATVETKFLARNWDCSPKLYVGYVDNIFVIVEEKKSRSKFLNGLNHGTFLSLSKKKSRALSFRWFKPSTQKRKIYDGKVN